MKTQDSATSAYELLRQIKAHLELEATRGIPAEWFTAGPAVSHPSVAAQPVLNVGAEAQAELPEPHNSNLYQGVSLEMLRDIASDCRKCRLCETRNKVVFGVGAIQSPRLVFVGEGPGADEDRVGEPFVGKAGDLLTAAITKGMGLQRSDVYICNVVKCRPPQNRTPLPDEVASCSPYLYRQLELLHPEVIVALGGPAQAALSGLPGGITRLRGQWQQWRGVPLMPTFHPAYILRNPSAKRMFWEDLQEVMRKLGISPSQDINRSEGPS